MKFEIAALLSNQRPEDTRMGHLFDVIKIAVAEGHYIVSQHAADRLDERGMLEWQIVEGLSHGSLVTERPRDVPNPLIEVRQCLSDGTEVKAVWSYIITAGVAKLVTVHFFDE